ncbi:microtubule-associated protein Jupiter-like [Euwallacea similis]|uniref:microtubule-associated protein Jupiter-like n=1 Tax=Euwallacea similis TaxID=1736056 RepID=UPI00344D3666
MANVFIGFPEHRNSSRVLKPPGGETSNIFSSEIIPDVIPQKLKEGKNRGSSIQDILRSETVTTSSISALSEEKISTTTTVNGSNTMTIIQESIENEVSRPGAIHSIPDVAAEVTCKVEQMKIEEKSSKMEATEMDSEGNTKIVANESNSETSVEQSSNVKKGSSIGEILSQESIEEKKKVKGLPSPRVPPGGFSSGLW